VFVLALTRLAGNRALGAITPHDFVVTLVVGDMLSDVFFKEISIATTLVGITTVIGCHVLLSVGTWKWKWLNTLFGSESTRLAVAGDLEATGMFIERYRAE